MTTGIRLGLAEARAALIAAQGLDRRTARPIPAVLGEAGFLRTLGGVEAYLALNARLADLKASQVHEVIAKGEARVVPAVRGCMYLVSAGQTPLALGLAAALARAKIEKEAEKAGVKPGEFEALGKKVLEALARGPLTTDGIKKALPAGAVRSLGEAGKKLGLSSTLPPALRLLELSGKIERTPEGARLDTERYLWRRSEGGAVEGDPVGLLARMAEVFFGAAGFGTLADFAAWAGVSQKEARAALERVRLAPVTIEGAQGERLALEARPPARGEGGAVAFLPFEDNLLALQGGGQILIDEAHHGLRVPSFGAMGDVTLGEAKHLSLRTFVAGGRVAGFWEYDPDGGVVWASLGPLESSLRKRVEAEAARTGEFLARDVGHGRSFSLDTDDTLRERAKWVKSLGKKPARKTKAKKKAKKTR